VQLLQALELLVANYLSAGEPIETIHFFHPVVEISSFERVLKRIKLEKENKTGLTTS